MEPLTDTTTPTPAAADTLLLTLDEAARHLRCARRSTTAAVRAAVRELERRRDTGRQLWTHDDITLAQWLDHWLDAVLPMTARWKTLSTYRSQMRRLVIPALGHVDGRCCAPSTSKSTTDGCKPTATRHT